MSLLNAAELDGTIFQPLLGRYLIDIHTSCR